MREQIQTAIAAAVKDLFNADVPILLERPDEQFGDYATNVALQLAGKVGKSPREIAEQLAAKLRETLIEQVSEVTVAGPGFLNLKLTDNTLVGLLSAKPPQQYSGQEVLVEFGDPNPFKEMHLGHLYTTVAGDAISRLFEASGASVKRLSYHGDVGMHVAKAIWAIRKHMATGQDVQTVLQAGIGPLYAEGSKAFEEDEQAAEEIRQVNELIYARSDKQVNDIYEVGKEFSFKAFDKIFAELGVKFVKRYLESDSSKVGLQFVHDNTGKVFEESDGAVVYKGEKAGLHTRVFINSRGLPTYEAKDLGLAELKNQDFPNASKSVIITAHEQSEYFRVMLAALAEIDPELAAKTQHIAHGFLSLTTGKMSSRSGNVFAAGDLLKSVEAAVKGQYPESKVNNDVYLAAVKYTFLKNRIGGDIVFDVKESVTLQGNSGPYLQYAHARARSILAKAKVEDKPVEQFEPGERSLLRKLGEYAEAVEQATSELMPHHVCTYLYELAQTFNSFYEHNRVLGDTREDVRLQLVQVYADTLKSGLELLGIPAPEQM